MQREEDEDTNLSAAIAASMEDNLQQYDDEEIDVKIAMALSKSECEEQHQRKQMEEEEQAELSRAVEMSVRDRLVEMDEHQAAEMAWGEALRESVYHESNRFASEEALRNAQQIKSEERRNGSWDCVACTFRNAPFSSLCEVCHAKPGKHILTFPPMSNLRFGVEIEIIIPNGRADGFTEEIIAQRLTQMGTRVTFCGYTHQTTNHWKIVTDSSIRTSSSSHLAFELVSPPLSGEAQHNSMSSFRALMQNIRRIGIDTNSSCGFHVHVDATPYTCAIAQLATLHGLTNLCLAFIAFENAFDLLVARSSSSPTQHRKERAASGNRYCRSNRLMFGSKSNRQRWEHVTNACYNTSATLTTLVNIINPNKDRYMKLNMTNIVNPDRPSTIEFRHHGGIVDILEAEAWIRFLLRFCENAALTHSETLKSLCLLPEKSTPQEELTRLFQMVNCEGLEQFYVMDRKLYVNHSNKDDARFQITNEWFCRVCKRGFGSSRSLSQHMDATGHTNGMKRTRRR
uniref:RanBP2-type domain-containing protein n=1 Tax=Ditylum brightwellii TaxID=49249 RepID=A0A7S4W5Y6_9STRA